MVFGGQCHRTRRHVAARACVRVCMCVRAGVCGREGGVCVCLKGGAVDSVATVAVRFVLRLVCARRLRVVEAATMCACTTRWRLV